MGGNGDGRIRYEAPDVPARLVLTRAQTNYQPTDDGGMELVFTPAVPMPGGRAYGTPQVRVAFDADGWERFKQITAADGLESPVVVASQLPG